MSPNSEPSHNRRRTDGLEELTAVYSMVELAHEINQPLTAIISQARACMRLIDADAADTALLRDSLDQIARQGERAAEVIRRLRKYVETRELEKQPSCIETVLRESLHVLDTEFAAHGVRLHIQAAEGLPEVLIDRIQMGQVLVNLARNAIEAMQAVPPEARELKFSICLAGPEMPGIEVAVQDSGPGFGAILPDRLFEPFYTTKSTGLGQGLSICRRIVRAHGGRLWASPPASGGAEFRFWLPLGTGT